MYKGTRSRVITAVVLIVLGLGLYGIQYLEELGKSVILMVLGALFTGLYLYSRSYLSLVAGGILLGLGIGSFGRQEWYVWGEFSKIGLGAGFIFIYLVALLYERRSRWWPLIPGSILILLGMGKWRDAWTFLVHDGWPLILVIIGVLILLGVIGKSKKQDEKIPEGGE